MSLHVLDIQLWIDRIASQCPQFQGRVNGAMVLEAALTQGTPRQMPSAYLVPASDQAASNELDVGLWQRNVSRFSVVIAVRNVADVTGAESHKELKTLREAIMTAILNWTPDSHVYEAAAFDRGSLSRFQNGVLWWEDIYQTTLYLQV